MLLRRNEGTKELLSISRPLFFFAQNVGAILPQSRKEKKVVREVGNTRKVNKLLRTFVFPAAMKLLTGGAFFRVCKTDVN